MAMRSAMEWSTPHFLRYGEWHLPYVSCLERISLTKEEAIKVSAARCCRVSYLNHGGATSTLNEDISLYDRLIKADPPHASPVEHLAMAVPGDRPFANFRGWKAHRWELEHARR